MIYDRIYADVTSAQALRQRGAPFTSDEINTLERGMVSINTLNRIESKQNELKEAMNDLGYWDTPFDTEEWGYSGYFTGDNLFILVAQNMALRQAFFVYSTTPQNPSPRYHYEEFNKIEKILLDIESQILYITNNYLECDTFYCGEY